MRTSPILAALLMLGGVSYAFAQEGPSDGPRGTSESGPSTAQERGSGSDAGVSNQRSAGEGASAKGNENGSGSKGRSAESSEKSNEKSASERTTGAAKKSDDKSSGKSTAESRSDESSGSKRMSRDDANKSGSPSPDTTDRSATDTTKGTSTERSAESKPSANKARQVDLTGDKRTKVQTAFRGVGNVNRRTNVDIDISVGRQLPRDWGFVPVPVAVIEIVPEYRDYYFAYVDDEYVIVEPDTYEVVAVLPAERSQAGTSGKSAGSGQCSAQLSLSSQERQLVLDNVKGGRKADVSDISVGREVPDGIELLRFPDNVISQAKELQDCQYFDAGDLIAIVDPDEDKIVAIIDKS